MRRLRVLGGLLAVYIAGCVSGVLVGRGQPLRDTAEQDRLRSLCARQLAQARERAFAEPSWENHFRVAEALANCRVVHGVRDPEPELVSLVETLAGTAPSVPDRDRVLGLLGDPPD